MQIILESQYPQGKLLKSDEFIKYLENRDLFIKPFELEFYDKNNTLRSGIKIESETQLDCCRYVWFYCLI